MTADEIEKEIRAISARLRAIDKDTPEMTGMDWASDHGWISTEEWEAAGERSKVGVKLQDAEVEKIENLRRQHPQAMDEFMGTYLERMKMVRDGLEKLSRNVKEGKLEFAMSFNLSLIPDIIACLSAWRNKKESKHWLAWAWRVAFSVVEESENFIEREGQNTRDKANG